MDKIRENLERHMNELCLRIGSKHVGAPGEAEAMDYIEQEFRAVGHDVVRETYPTRGWEFKSFEFINVTRGYAVPVAVPCFFSNRVDIEDKLLWLNKHDLPKLPELPVKGRLCMLEYWSGPSEVMGRNQIAEELDRLGAAAAIFISNEHTALAPSTKIQRSPFLKQLGTCAVAQEGALALARYRHDTYRLRIDARCFDHTSANVIARQIGNGPKGVIGAHYDTAPLVQGAGDNASGTAMILELARLLKDINPGWNLDFAAFGAEEYIPESLAPGSGDYVARHKGEDIRWLFNFDDFGLLIGDPFIKVGHGEKLPPLYSKRYPVVPSTVCSGDDKAFYQLGIPTIWYYDKNPFYYLHTAEDNLDKIDFDKMAAGVADSVELFKQLTASEAGK